MGRQLWSVYKELGAEAFREALKNPTALSWVSDQINQDREERNNLILQVFDLVKPWLNLDLYSAIEKKKQQKEDKIARIAKTDANKVEVLNLFDTMMKNAGINVEKES